MKPIRNPFTTAFLAVIAASATSSLRAQIAWDGNGTPSNGGNWSTGTNWAGDVAPTAGNIANLDDTTANRTIIYDAAASGALGTLNFNQSSAFSNILEIQRSALAVTSAITLGAASGTERISFNTINNASTLTASGGLTLNAGSELSLSAYRVSSSASVNLSNITGNVAISGGSLQVRASDNNAGGNTATSAQNLITGNLTMSSGSLVIDNSTGLGDRRLSVSGTVTITGGSISSTLSGTNGMLSFQNGGGITFNPGSFDTDLNLALDGSSSQSLSTDKSLGNMLLRGTGIKTVTSSSSGTGIGQLQLFDGNSAVSNSRTSLQLGSNLTLTTGRNQPAAQSFGNTHESGRIDLGIDTNGFTLDLSAGASSGVWTPNASTQSGVTNTVWDLSGNGVIKANAFTLTTSGVTTNIAANTVLTAAGGNSSATNLGGTGTIDSNSIFRYSGTAVTATPATLTANRSLGDLEVTSGSLRVLTGSTGTVQDLRVSGGTLDLDANTGRTFATISLTGGTLANGTYATAEANYTGLQTGTVSGKLTGAKQLIKNSAGTLTLSNVGNDYSGSTVVQSGTLAITTAGALTGTSSLEITGGTLDLGGQTINKYITTLSNGGVIQNGSFLRTGNTNWTLANGIISANLTTSGSGAINITKNTSGTVILSGANSHAGSTLVTAGTLQLSGSGTLGSGPVSVSGGTLDLGAKSITNTLGVLSGGAVNNGTINNDSGAYDLRKGSVGAILAGTNGLTKSTADTVTLSGSNTYSGPTLISGGTLKLDAAGTIDNTSEVSLGTAGTFDVSAKGLGYSVGTLRGSGNVTGNLTVSTQLAIGNSPGTTSFSGNLSLGAGSTFLYEITGGISPGGGSADLGDVAGNLNITAGAILDLVQLGAYTIGNKFTLFAYDGLLTGTFNDTSANTLTDGGQFTDAGGIWEINYDDTTSGSNGGSGLKYVTITSVPEPATALLGGSGLILLLRRRRHGMTAFRS